ncbi:potassium-transporting ATPase subunit KdpA, partial [Burkholderia ubonensis]|uniref:potassium-transporting ATPase subunit KdpA n=1 Tax=Burkholderia ubonensis TaxID=101571 RepID=UPI00016A2F14
MFNNLIQFVIVLAIMLALAPVVGKWLAHAFTSPRHAWAEQRTYALLGVDPAETMSWKRYGMVLLLSNAGMMLLGYLLLRVQDMLPFDSLQRASQSPDLAFNTAASFITNTNWQAYAGESSLSNFSQMAVITFLMTVSAATGVAAAGGFIRGLSRRNAADIGNYWVDFTRVIYRVLLPLCFVMALVYVWQGMPQTLASDAWATTLEGARQQIVTGPVASLESIKHIGTNGGGFFSMIGRRRQGWVILGAFVVMFVGFLAVSYQAERHGNPLLAGLGVDLAMSAEQPGGNMEGKEMRFGIAQTSLFATVTTVATTGSVDAMHDSLTPLGALVP